MSSEDLPYFTKKLNDYLKKVQSDFNIFRIFVITFFIFIYIVIYGYICKKKYGNST